MTLQETQRQIQQLRKKVSTDLPREIAKIIAADTVSQIETRVRDKQMGCNGSFGKYSTRPMLTSGETAKGRRVWRAVAGSKSKRKNLDWVTIKRGGKNIKLFELKGGYAELRRLEGFSNTNKSFEFTGEMWRKFGVVSVSQQAGKLTVKLGGKTTAAQDKIDWNSEREGVDIIDACKAEVEWLQRRVGKILEGYVVELKLN